MRYLTFSLPNERTQRVGVLDRDRVVELPEFPNMLAHMHPVISGGTRRFRARARTSSVLAATMPST